eukprot:1157467-Pelagomonas_calceolata.AAC.5
MKAKLALLRNTNMVDFAMDIHKSLYEGSPIPPAMKERRAEVVARLRQLQQDVDPIIKCLENPNVVRNFRQDKTFNMQLLLASKKTPSRAAATYPKQTSPTLAGWVMYSLILFFIAFKVAMHG